jgi:hypothetical protein
VQHYAHRFHRQPSEASCFPVALVQTAGIQSHRSEIGQNSCWCPAIPTRLAHSASWYTQPAEARLRRNKILAALA